MSKFEIWDSEGDFARVNAYPADSRFKGIVHLQTPNCGVHLSKQQIEPLCSAIYTAAGLTPKPDLTTFIAALETLATKHASDQSIEMACIALFEEARKVGLLQPEADALDSVRTSLRDIAADTGLSKAERDKAQRALEAMS